MKDRIILHLDMNAFFASVEQQANPALPILNPNYLDFANHYGFQQKISLWVGFISD